MRTALMMMAALLVAPLLARADEKEDVKSAAKKLADAKSYSWTTKTELGGGGNFRPGPEEGKTEKDGFTLLTFSFGDNTTEAVLKGSKGAIKTEDGWKTLEEATADGGGGGGFNPGRMLAFRLQNYKTPAQMVEEACDKVKEVKKSGDAYEGELSEDAVKQLLRFRRPRGNNAGNGPEISNAKGTVKLWTKDGVLSKIESHIQGTISTPNGDRDIDRTSTTEIKDVDSTKVEVPDEAKKKLE